MKRILLFLIFTLFATNIIVAQFQGDTANILPKKILSAEFINFGGAFPVGSFGKRTKNADFSGFANAGLHLSSVLNYQLYKNLSIKSQIGFQSNQIDSYRYKKFLIEENSQNSYTISTGAWQNIFLLFGVNANFNIDEDLTFQPKILLGGNFGISPVINLTVRDSAQNITVIKQNKANIVGFCYVLGADFKLKLVKGFYALFSGEFFNSDLQFEKVLLQNNTGRFSTELNFRQPVQTLNLKFGIGKTIN
jgi:hypothetical protein